MSSADLSSLESTIETAFDNRDSVSVSTKGEIRDAVEEALNLLDGGTARVAERGADGVWKVNQWLKKAVLLSFRLNDMEVVKGGPGNSTWWDKIPSKFENWGENQFRSAGFRAVPNTVVRRSAYIAKNVVLMPSFVNLGAYVDEGTMVDTWATVGSCAQIGKHVHLSGGVGIGGVLEPMQAGPTIIEDNCFIGARSEVVEGCIIREGSVLAWASTSASRRRSSIAPPAKSPMAKSRLTRSSLPAPWPLQTPPCRMVWPPRISTAPSSSRPSTRRPAPRPASTNSCATKRRAESRSFKMSAADPIANLGSLIRCPSVTPAEGGALTALEAMLKPLGFVVERMVASHPGMPDIENLYARLGQDGPHLMFAGHTDVVPPGDEAAWRHPPFSAAIEGGEMFGRGAVDMKGGIACFVAAVARHIEAHGAPKGSISFLITGDEEGPAVNGTEKLLKWATDKGERWDACLVGEPTNPDVLGDMIKIGRRGSVSGKVTVSGVQGHAAYPHLADNPVRGLLPLADALMSPPFDEGTPEFPASNLEVTTIDVGNTATNVIPSKAQFAFNIRFNDTWTADTVKAEILRRLEAAASDETLRPGREPTRYEITWPNARAMSS